ncbi:c-type cytochrome [Paracoccus sp. SCSIO 75233]|uniref:c-type cytochrome n=1 Tax=Paracoccus sp. SCSIO 75233 TaxID=3017782 RepID=UPI0022F12D43|nr:c-type cytochrome [Paracoccus sp. SCSIO 75233]WBU51908.1 c-type cytochrome [Paracoccus sp. SCSIO 75233]
MALAMLAGPATAQEGLDHGRALFEGEAGSGLLVRIGQRQVPAQGISCAGCHGGDAGGGAEVQSGPDITWTTLTAKGYSPEAFARALTEGLRPDGSELGGAMPRFGFSDADDPAALIAYLDAVAGIQRSGLNDTQILLGQAAETRSATAFWDGFRQQVDGLAPNGVFGRQLRLSEEAAGFVVIGAAQPVERPGVPSLFPLAPLLGDEDTAFMRGGYATLSLQIRAAADHAGGIQVQADPALQTRLGSLLRGADVVFDDASAGDDRPVMVLGIDRLATPPEAPALYATVDDLARLADPLPGCVIATDPRGSDPSQEPLLSRYGRAAATALLEALKLCGADCTRSRLMLAFDEVRVSVPGWPDLDYSAHRLTGTDDIALWSFCGDRVERIEQAVN